MPPGFDLVTGGGTVGIIALLAIAAWTLYRRLEKEQEAAVARLVQHASELRDERDEALAGWRAQTAATDKGTEALLRLTAAIEARNELELAQRRRR